MKDLLIIRLTILILLVSVAMPAFPAITLNGSISGAHAYTLSGSITYQNRKAGVKKPKSAKKAQKKQKAKEAKQDRDYEKFVKENKKRSLEIQTPAVRERMKQNVKDADANYRAKKKSNAARTKKGAKKYRK